jgi:hypothetical protein
MARNYFAGLAQKVADLGYQYDLPEMNISETLGRFGGDYRPVTVPTQVMMGGPRTQEFGVYNAANEPQPKTQVTRGAANVPSWDDALKRAQGQGQGNGQAQGQGQGNGGGGRQMTLGPDGREYDLTDPQDRVRYLQAVNNPVLQEYDREVAEAEAYYNDQEGRLVETKGRAKRSLDEAEADLGTKRKNYFEQTGEDREELSGTYRSGTAQRDSRFAAAALLQGSQGSGQALADKELNENMAEIAEDEEEATVQFDRGTRDLGESRFDLERSFEDDRKKLTGTVDKARRRREEAVRDAQIEQVNYFSEIDGMQGLDLSRYEPYMASRPAVPTAQDRRFTSGALTFGNAAAAPGTMPGVGQAVLPKQKQGQDPLQNYFKNGYAY